MRCFLRLMLNRPYYKIYDGLWQDAFLPLFTTWHPCLHRSSRRHCYCVVESRQKPSAHWSIIIISGIDLTTWFIWSVWIHETSYVRVLHHVELQILLITTKYGVEITSIVKIELKPKRIQQIVDNNITSLVCLWNKGDNGLWNCFASNHPPMHTPAPPPTASLN